MYSCQQKEEEIWRFNAVVDGLPNLCSVLDWDPRMTGKAEKEAGRHKGKKKVYTSKCLLPKVTDDRR